MLAKSSVNDYLSSYGADRARHFDAIAGGINEAKNEKGKRKNYDNNLASSSNLNLELCRNTDTSSTRWEQHFATARAKSPSVSPQLQ